MYVELLNSNYWRNRFSYINHLVWPIIDFFVAKVLQELNKPVYLIFDFRNTRIFYIWLEGTFIFPLVFEMDLIIRLECIFIALTCVPVSNKRYEKDSGNRCNKSSWMYATGKPLRWEEKVHLRHMPSRQYLCLADGEFYMNESSQDPNSVFRFIPLTRVSICLLCCVPAVICNTCHD